jgi:hypothetical protein
MPFAYGLQAEDQKMHSVNRCWTARHHVRLLLPRCNANVREDTGVSDERDTDEMVMVFEWICSTAQAAPFPFRTNVIHGPPRSDQF